VRKDFPPFEKSYEAQIMDLSDDISYCVHDFEDSVALGKLNPIQLKIEKNQDKILKCIESSGAKIDKSIFSNAFKYLQDKGYFSLDFQGTFADLGSLKNLTSSLIGDFMQDLEQNKGKSDKFANIYPKELHAKIEIFKSASVLFYMETRDMAGVKASQQKTIFTLAEKLMQFSPSPSPILEPIFAEMWEKCNSEDERLRVAIDQIASLTDTRAKELAGALV
jgi:dGTPase